MSQYFTHGETSICSGNVVSKTHWGSLIVIEGETSTAQCLGLLSRSVSFTCNFLFTDLSLYHIVRVALVIHQSGIIKIFTVSIRSVK